MASQPYSPRSSAYWSASPAHVGPAVGQDTPPPPPPKPTSHEASRRGTPLAGAAGLQSPGHPQGDQGVNLPGTASTQLFPPGDPNTQVEPPRIEDGWLPDIVKDKSTTELQEILSNASLLSALSTLHPSYPTSQQYLESHLESNKALAQHVLDLESRVASLRSSTESLLLNHQSLEVSWRKKQTEMDAALAPWSPKALYQRLAAAVAEQEAICHAVEESFLEGDHQHGKATDKEVTDWVRRIRTEGAKLEARKEARARWDEGRVGGWR
ncbi:uncharacterized protein TRUGW13939_03203 [Talaromyces rugulosus]|uniref:VPS37 C-terminal domain-containing protein n=1 Tax=Talaromyces rugulosus TaxID=121627 RepID=A0A7H8QSL0_TALRU|nr:uncharacterized protein TRUGW13939_03203 [Talaromyces rugulosus]QKX56103.1 hypothetical protein TRUGW13939_03203 [Talaromyces rugulosus]